MIKSNFFLLIFLDDLEQIPDLKCVPDLECVLDNKNAFLILNVLLKKFPFRTVPLQIVPIFLRTRSMQSFFFRKQTCLSVNGHGFTNV